MEAICLYHGKLRDTRRFPEKMANDDLELFAEWIKKNSFENSNAYAKWCNNQQMMIISLHDWRGQKYCVYTYFISARDTLNRSGGYLCISLIVKDTITTKRRELFDIFEKVHNRLQEEHVLSSGKILIEEFTNKRDFFTSLSSTFRDAPDNLFNDSISIKNVLHDENKSIGFNIEDCNSQQLIDNLLTSGVVYISNQFCSMKENNEYKTKYEELQRRQQQADSRRRDEAKGNSRNDQKVADLQAENKRLKEKIAALQASIDNVRTAVGQAGKKLEQTTQIVANQSKKVWQDGRPRWWRLSLFFPIINTLLLIALIFLLFVRFSSIANDLEQVKKNNNHTSITNSVTSAHHNENAITEVTIHADPEESETIADESIHESQMATTQPTATITTQNQKINKTRDIKILVKTVNNNQYINPSTDTLAVNEVIKIESDSKEAAEYQVYCIEGCKETTEKTIRIDGSSDKAMFYFCHPDDKDVSFDKQKNKRTFQIKKQ